MKEITRRLLSLLGYESLYPPQEEAIKRGVEDGANLLVATPTASGKTLIGAIAIANALERDPRGRAFYLVPLRSVAMEKYSELRVLEKLGISVGLAIGDVVTNPGARLLVSTYEKLDSMLRSRPGSLEGLRALVVDEVHYLGDEKRGIVLESLLASILSSTSGLQIVALSATVPNAGEIAEWLGAEAVVMDWRPVPLREAVLKGYELYYPREDRWEELERVTGKQYLDAALAVNRSGGQALVFSMSRRRVVQLASSSARHHRRLNYDKRVALEAASEIMDTGGPLPLREELAGLLKRGVAYHHAGLSSEQRRIIEDAFRRGGVAVLHATPTLAAGVNLPARLVVVEEYYRFEDGMRRPIPVFEYKQLSGRAGRPGYDDEGLSVIVAARSDSPEEVASYYILGPVEEVRSRLGSPRGLRHALLSLLARGAASIEAVESFLAATLHSRQDPFGSLASKARRALSTLSRWGLVEERSGLYSLTMLGAETARLYLDPESVPILERLASRARTISDAVLLYIVASMPDTPRLRASRREQEKLVDLVIEEYPDVLDLVEAFGPDEASAVKTMRLLHLWITEETEDRILEETGAGPGDVRSITETASWVSSALSRIAPHIGAAELGESFRLVSQRLKYGVKPELLPLVSIPGVGRVRARRLYEAGYRTLHDLALASPEELLRVKGLGPSTVRSILEALGRAEEAGKLKGSGRGRGLEAFLDI